MLGRAVPLLLLGLAFNPRVIAQDLRIGVVGLFHPHELRLQASRNEAVIIHAAGQTFVLEPGSRIATVHISDDALLLDFGGHVLRTAELHATARNNGAVSFLLTVPGKITRAYRGIWKPRSPPRSRPSLARICQPKL